MIAIPAVDLRDGACVQLVGGSYANERVRLDSPVAVACKWSALGFSRLHVVDLDAATDRGDNSAAVQQILGSTPAAVQVGGGLRTTDRVDQLLAAGATHAVVGTRAIENPDWLEELTRRHPSRIIVAADVRGRRVVTHGWEQVRPIEVSSFVSALSSLALGGILVTAVDVEGSMKGPDLPLVDEVIQNTSHRLMASGGIGTMDDLRELGRRGVAAVVIGMALYTGALDPGAVAREFSA